HRFSCPGGRFGWNGSDSIERSMDHVPHGRHADPVRASRSKTAFPTPRPFLPVPPALLETGDLRADCTVPREEAASSPRNECPSIRCQLLASESRLPASSRPAGRASSCSGKEQKDGLDNAPERCVRYGAPPRAYPAWRTAFPASTASESSQPWRSSHRHGE